MQVLSKIVSEGGSLTIFICTVRLRPVHTVFACALIAYCQTKHAVRERQQIVDPARQATRAPRVPPEWGAQVMLVCYRSKFWCDYSVVKAGSPWVRPHHTPVQNGTVHPMKDVDVGDRGSGIPVTVGKRALHNCSRWSGAWLCYCCQRFVNVPEY